LAVDRVAMGSTSGLAAGILDAVVCASKAAPFSGERRSRMTLKELADALEKVDEEAFASMLLEYELSHDDGPKQVKAMIIAALRFSDQNGMRTPRPPLDEAD
jgi:hypothetical protein